MNIEGKLRNIQQSETLLLDGKEIGRIGFEIQTETGMIEAYAIAAEGTAFHTLKNDQRLRSEINVEITGVKTEIGFKVLTIRIKSGFAKGAVITDIETLKNRAMQNMNLTQGELYALLSAFSPDSPQHYAVAVQLRRKYSDKTVTIAEKVCRCQRCRATFELDSPRYTFAWGKTRCSRCNETVAFDLVDPLPREADEEVSWQAMEKRLQEQGERRMTIHLLNAAVMPQSGYYELEDISLDEFAASVREAYIDGNLQHYIGYQSTLNLIADLCNIDLGGINVDQTELEDGDIFYVARLRRRVSPQAKRVATRGQAAVLDISEFDFFRGKYSVMEG